MVPVGHVRHRLHELPEQCSLDQLVLDAALRLLETNWLYLFEFRRPATHELVDLPFDTQLFTRQKDHRAPTQGAESQTPRSLRKTLCELPAAPRETHSKV